MLLSIVYDKFFIGGQWVNPSTQQVIAPINPSTEQPLGQVPEGVEADIDAGVAAARAAFDDPRGWSQWEPAQRAEAMLRLADEIDKRAEDFRARVSSQNGMPVAVASQLEIGYPSTVLRYYANLLKQTSFSEVRPGLLGGEVEVRRKAIGVVAAIVPWNFPQTLTMFKLAPALAAGCTLLIKPSPETVLDAYTLAEAIEAANLPAGVVNIVPAGRKIGEVCGRLLRPVTLELGGKSAAIVLDDADLNLDQIGQGLFGSTLLNNGQTCFLGTRVLAPKNRYQEVVDAFTAFAGSLKVGDAAAEDTLIGPMATARQRERVESYISQGKAAGGQITVGGGRPSDRDRGYFVEPTVFAGLDNSAVISQEEIFGPVLTIISYDSDDEAVRIANDSEFGLGGTVWTTDPERGAALARRVHTGTIGVNRYIPDPAAPFGGVKASGLGRELGPEGLNSYLEAQSIYL